MTSDSFEYIFCHNVLHYADGREIIAGEFYPLLKKGGKLAIVKHNRNGRVMQMIVFLNNFEEANNLLGGQNSNAQQFGTIIYYDDREVSNWCNRLVLLQTYGLRTFWDLQQKQKCKKLAPCLFELPQIVRTTQKSPLK